MKPILIEAIRSLIPDAEVVVSGEEIQWFKPLEAPISLDEIKAELARLQAEYEKLSYKRQRASEYPDVKDYIDGVVKNDQAQIQTYIDACLAVKAKYPKSKG